MIQAPFSKQFIFKNSFNAFLHFINKYKPSPTTGVSAITITDVRFGVNCQLNWWYYNITIRCLPRSIYFHFQYLFLMSKNLTRLNQIITRHIHHFDVNNPENNNCTYRRKPYHCLGIVLPKGPLWCNADSLFIQDGLFD